MLIAKDSKVTYDQWHDAEVSDDGRVFTTKFDYPIHIKADDQLIGELCFEK